MIYGQFCPILRGAFWISGTSFIIRCLNEKGISVHPDCITDCQGDCARVFGYVQHMEGPNIAKSKQLGYDLVKRAIYYTSILISSQKSEFFIKSDYDEIRKFTAFGS